MSEAEIRKQVAEEIAKAIETRREAGRSLPVHRIAELPTPYDAFTLAAGIARNHASQPSPDPVGDGR